MNWAHQAKTAHLSPRDLHFSVKTKFWPKVKYGLCANSSPNEEFVSAMHKSYYILCPLGCDIQSAKKKLRYLDMGFFGVGLPHWGVEAIGASTNKLMTHFGTTTLVMVQYQALAELLAIELGKGPQPLCLDYDRYHH